MGSVLIFISTPDLTGETWCVRLLFGIGEWWNGNVYISKLLSQAAVDVWFDTDLWMCEHIGCEPFQKSSIKNATCELFLKSSVERVISYFFTASSKTILQSIQKAHLEPIHQLWAWEKLSRLSRMSRIALNEGDREGCEHWSSKVVAGRASGCSREHWPLMIWNFAKDASVDCKLTGKCRFKKGWGMCHKTSQN